MKKYIYIVPLSMMLAACADETFPDSNNPAYGSGSEISINASIEQVNVSRANDNGFATGDRIGLYVVNSNADGSNGDLLPSGNWIDNVGFTYSQENDKWTADRPIYFKDDKTKAVFYAYYPYIDQIENPRAYHFEVHQNQSTESNGNELSGYEASDLLLARADANVSNAAVPLVFHHQLAGVMVTLTEGYGFDDDEWLTLDKTVMVDNTVRAATVDMQTATVNPEGNGDGKSILAARNNNSFRAVVIPNQSIAAGQSILSITIDGTTLHYSRSETTRFEPMHLHKFTIKVNKANPDGDYSLELADEVITVWESDAESHSGKVIEYIVVETPEPGQLKSTVQGMGLVVGELRNVKITGELNQSDFDYIRSEMKYLEALNLREATLRECYCRDYTQYKGGDTDKHDYTIPDQAFFEMTSLTTIVFPQKLKAIGSGAFLSTGLTGSLTLPEGLEYIAGGAFGNWTSDKKSLSGSLALPSTLKYIGQSAFSNNNFTGTLVLPDAVEYIGESAFYGCKNFTGEVHLPSSLKTLEGGAFGNMRDVTGEFKFPRNCNKVLSLGGEFGVTFTSVCLPDAPTEIEREAFRLWTGLRGDLIVPESVTKIGAYAFARTKISHLVLPPKLEYIEPGICSNCLSLQDTLTIPSLVETIDREAFDWCVNLEALILPRNLQEIKERAFNGCSSLSYIRCDAIVPPVLDGSAFEGIAKDNFTVEVPEESVDAYRNAPGWKEFRRISAYRNFVARPSQYNVLNKGGEREIILNADGDWTLVECPAWCHIDKASGSMKTVLKLTVDPMNHNAGDRTGIVTFKLNGNDEHLTHINVGQYDYQYEEDSYIQINQATRGSGIDIVLVGDGFDAIDIASGLYLESMKQEMEYFFDVEPYKTYRNYFNVYVPFARSEDSGVETLATWRTTKFESKIGDGKTRLTANWEKALDYCGVTIPQLLQSSTPRVGCILVLNTDMYEGVTYTTMGGDTFCAVVTMSAENYPNDARGLIQHEAGGHGFGWLADEYIYHVAFIDKCDCLCCQHADELLAAQAYGWGLNVALNGKYKSVPWTHLIFNPAYSDIVDIYEGGYFHSRGVYRSEYNSCMNNNVPYFSTWSRQLIVQRIKYMAGEEFDLNDFYAHDSRAVGTDFTGSRSHADLNTTEHVLHGAPPVKITNYKFGKGGAKR